MTSAKETLKAELKPDRQLRHVIATRLKLNHLRVLLEIARQNSISKAAAALNLAQPAVTKTLKEAEAIFGTPLFDRRPRGVALNEAGQIVLPHVQILFAELYRIGDELSAYRSGFGGIITLGGTMSALPYLLPKTVTSFSRHAVSSTIRIIEGTVQQMLDSLMRGEVDLVLGRVLADPATSDQLVQEIMLNDPFVPVVRPGHPLTQHTPTPFAELFTYPWVLAPEGNASRDTFERYIITLGARPPRSFVETVSFQVLLGILGATDSIGIVPRHLATAGVARGELAIIGPSFPEGSLPVGVTYRRDQALTPMATALIRGFRQTIHGIDDLSSIRK